MYKRSLLYKSSRQERLQQQAAESPSPAGCRLWHAACIIFYKIDASVRKTKDELPMTFPHVFRGP